MWKTVTMECKWRFALQTLALSKFPLPDGHFSFTSFSAKTITVTGNPFHNIRIQKITQ